MSKRRVFMTSPRPIAQPMQVEDEPPHAAPLADEQAESEPESEPPVPAAQTSEPSLRQLRANLVEARRRLVSNPCQENSDAHMAAKAAVRRCEAGRVAGTQPAS